jgi:hypothetical protein
LLAKSDQPASSEEQKILLPADTTNLLQPTTIQGHAELNFLKNTHENRKDAQMNSATLLLWIALC